MSKAHLSETQFGRRVGSGHSVAPGVAGWLSFAAAPTFALMALWTGVQGGQPDVLCMSIPHASPMTGMTAMYLLMSAFHLPPWLRLIAGRRNRSPDAAVSVSAA